MKNILFFLLILITLNNVSFASFPVSENQQREIIELVTSESNKLVDYERLNFYARASFLLFILALCFVMAIIVGTPTMSISGPTIAQYIAYAIYSMTAAIVLGIISFFK